MALVAGQLLINHCWYFLVQKNNEGGVGKYDDDKKQKQTKNQKQTNKPANTIHKTFWLWLLHTSTTFSQHFFDNQAVWCSGTDNTPRPEPKPGRNTKDQTHSYNIAMSLVFEYNHVGTRFFQASHKYDLKILKGHVLLYYKFLINDVITSVLERIRWNTGE